MNVSLTPELDQWVQDRVRSGLYTSSSEVVREALRLLREQDELKQLRRDELRRAIQTGLDDVDAGRLYPATDAFFEGIAAEGNQRLAGRRSR